MERTELLPAMRLKRRIEDSPELAALIELADSIGTDGRDYALRLIREKFDRTPVAGSPERFMGRIGSEG